MSRLIGIKKDRVLVLEFLRSEFDVDYEYEFKVYSDFSSRKTMQ